MKRYLFLSLVLLAFPVIAPLAQTPGLGDVVTDVVGRHMKEKHIPGLSVAIVQDGAVLFSAGYGLASIEFDVPSTPETVYPISSVSKIFAGLLAVRLVAAGKLDLDRSIADFFDDVPADKQSITVRHLLQHTHGLDDFYRSDEFERQTGKTVGESSTEALIHWTLRRPLQFSPGNDWAYSLAGYVLLARVFEEAGGRSYANLVDDYVFKPIGMHAVYGGSESVVSKRNAILYEWLDGKIAGRVVEFPPRVYAAGGLNTSVVALARLFAALSGDQFVSKSARQALWHSPVLASGKPANYGLGWFSYTTSQDRWVVGHEGGGASWVIYYPDLDLAVIALSNMSGARADSLPYEIAREALDKGLLRAD